MVILTLVLSWNCSQALGWGSIWKLDWNWGSASKVTHRAVGRRFQFFGLYASLQGCPCMIGLPAEPMTAKSETKTETESQKWFTIPSAIFYWSHKPTLLQCGKELHEDMNTRMQGASGTILEAEYHTRFKELKHSHL